MPIFIPVIVGLLAMLAPDDGPLPSLPVFTNENTARDALGLLWQVEGSILALVVAALLFVFEGMTRARPDVSVWVYAQRSRLTWFLMLGAAGVLAIPVALFWSAARPPLAAAHVAFVAGVAGLLGLPFLFYRASRVISPTWLRQQQLADIQNAVGQVVEMEVMAQVARAELEALVDQEIARSASRLHSGLFPLEATSTRSMVYDIVIPQLNRQGMREQVQLLILCRLGEVVAADTPLVSTRTPLKNIDSKPICILSSDLSRDRLASVIRQLRDEGTAVIKNESASGVEAVADAYIALWLAWPRMRLLYQSLAVSIDERTDPFRRDEISDIGRHLRSLILTSSEHRLEDHSRVLTGIIFKVGREAGRSGATDVLQAVCALAQSVLGRTSKDESNLQSFVNVRSSTLQIDLCRFVFSRDLADDSQSYDVRRSAADSALVVYQSIGQSLRILAALGEWELFDQADRDYAKDLARWQSTMGRDELNELFEQADDLKLSAVEIENAVCELRLLDLRGRLELERDLYRLSILGWLLRAIPEGGSHDRRMESSVAALLRSLGERAGGMTQATGTAIQEDRGPLSWWISSELRAGEFAFIDSDGPLLRALAMVLMTAGSIRPLIAPWMSEERAQALKGFLGEISQSERDRRLLGITESMAQEISARVTRLIDGTVSSNTEQEATELIGQQLDQSKVDEFRRAVVDGWQDARLLPDLLAVASVPFVDEPIEGWGDQRLGNRQLLPKGLFVSPSNWGGLDHLGRSLGEAIAYGEIERIFEELREISSQQPGGGDPAMTLSDAIDELTETDYEPSLIILPPDYELLRSLGLPPWQPPDPSHGKLGIHIKGLYRDIPVVEWRMSQLDAIVVADTSKAVRVTQAVDALDQPQKPRTDIEAIAKIDAEAMISRDPKPEMTHDERLRELLTSVRSYARIPYRVEGLDRLAARYISLSPNSREAG